MDRKVYKYVEKNGDNIYLVEEKTQIQDIYIVFNIGSLDEKKNNNGVAHLIEHMCIHFMQRFWKENYINVEVRQFEGYTDYDRIVLNIHGKIDSTNDIYFINRMIWEMLQGRMIREREFYKSKEEIISECKNRDDKERVKKVILLTNGMINYLPVGNDNDIRDLTFNDVIDYFYDLTLCKKGFFLIGVPHSARQLCECFGTKWSQSSFTTCVDEIANFRVIENYFVKKIIENSIEYEIKCLLDIEYECQLWEKEISKSLRFLYFKKEVNDDINSIIHDYILNIHKYNISKKVIQITEDDFKSIVNEMKENDYSISQRELFKTCLNDFVFDEGIYFIDQYEELKMWIQEEKNIEEIFYRVISKFKFFVGM